MVSIEGSEKQLAAIFKALGDPHRLHILRLLRQGETCSCRLLEDLDISQPTLSHHMKILCEAGIVTGRRDGKWVRYSICCEKACQIRKLLLEITTEQSKPANCSCRQQSED